MVLEFRHPANDNKTEEQQKLQARREFIADSSSVLNSILKWIQSGEPDIKKWDDAQREAFFTIKKGYTEANRVVIALEEDLMNDETYQRAERAMSEFLIRLVELEPYLPPSPQIPFEEMPPPKFP